MMKCKRRSGITARHIGLGSGAGVLLMMGVQSLGDIVGSKHDFSSQGWSQGEICLPCHTPHHADTSASAPLWNHQLTTATYTLYGGDQGGVEDLDSHSVLCMSCHDGTVALDSFGGNSGDAFIDGDARIGVDLRDDHPVGGTGVYPDVPWLRNPDEWENQPHGFALHEWVDPDTNESFDVVSCYTCHEPHNRHNTEFMLWKPNIGSALCLTCHLFPGNKNPPRPPHREPQTIGLEQ